ncbi:dynein axonemal intermediate chain 4 isoform X1 [Takifugu flavidus]|uniref:dynein axonemal intermediate chain 4 isoform X1 n=1 Tax=Takifugu flavidus TaxID=433684 RepID=UPI0025449054|nr:dynein axonemal intermediate chain 4 isoform X1 [Takifugu flavidus]
MIGTANKSFRNLERASTLMDKSVTQSVSQQAVRVFDKDGNDITPQPLYPVRHSAAAVQCHKFSRFLDEISVGAVSETSGDSICSIPFSRSTGSNLSILASTSLMTDGPLSKRPIPTYFQGLGQNTDTVIEDVTEDMLKEKIYVNITETDCITVLDIRSACVSVDSDDAPGVLECNSHYAEVCNSSSGTDKYVSESVQTLKGPVKNKQVQTDCVVFVDSAVNPYNALSAEQHESLASVNPKWAAVESIKAAERGLSASRSASTVSATSSTAIGEEIGSILTPELELQSIMSSGSFQNCLKLMERIILANTFQSKFASYRLLPIIKGKIKHTYIFKNHAAVFYWTVKLILSDQDIEMEEVEKVEVAEGTEDSESPEPPAAKLLWVFNCELIRGCCVTTMAWNKKNPDLLAVGYGNFDFTHHKPGLVCCWSIKNTKFPNRIIHCDGVVTSLDFSFNNPSQLAVGMLDGTIAIYNIHNQDIKSCVYSTSESPNRHMGPVGQLKWCHQNLDFSTKKDCVDSLFSVAADGRTSRWNQGSSSLDCVELMKLSRVLHTQKSTGNTTGDKSEQNCVLTSLTPGLTFDFHPVDSNIYLIGTWDGLIHKCSCSNTQHFLETYRSHLCAVNVVTWSPFSLDVFLSCSSDCTVQLWKQNHLHPLLTFICIHGAVEDIKWSPRHATLFGVVSNRQLEIWDLSLNILEPVIIHPAAPTVDMKNLLFSTQTDCVLVGDSSGVVSVYQLKNLHGKSSQVDVLDGIICSLLS